MFVDVNMPRMDGYTFVASVREGGLNCQTPIVMVSTEDGAGDMTRGYAAGANVYLTAPDRAAAAIQTTLGRVVEHSRALAANAGGELDAAELERLRTDLTEVKNSYVMQRQRETHGHVTATAMAADSAPPIELF